MTIPANTLGTTSGIRAKMFISNYRNNVSTYGGTFKLKYGGTTLITLTLSATQIASAIAGYLDVFLLATGATNTQEASMGLVLRASETVTTNSATYTNYAQYYGTGTAAEDSTGALTLAITFQWASSDAANTMTMAHTVIERISA